jgi:hypothetical protein
MYSTTAYLYQQRLTVISVDTSGAYFDRRWQPVYAKNLKINLGVDNVILFEFINQDQKPVNISGSTITFRLTSQEGNELLIAKDLVALNSTYGRAKVTLTEADVSSLEAGVAGWSLERGSGDLWEAVYVDSYVGSRGMADIVDGVYPDFTESKDMNIPDHPDGIEIENPNRVHTGIVYIGENNYTTFQFDFDNFTGNVKAQASDTQLGPWYDVGNQTVYTNQTDRAHVNIAGVHNYLRFEINQYGNNATATAIASSGAVSSITVQNGGDQYISLGSPNVEIEGLGTGATASATVTDNSVSGITITDSGQGYVGGYAGLQPNVKINMGSITSISYR